MWNKLFSYLRNSAHVHLRQPPPSQMSDLVALLDRFLDDHLNYDLEWDDFISWKHSNPNIEAIRLRVADTESLFFSNAISDRQHAVALLVEERNRAAALLGISPRAHPEWRRPMKYDLPARGR